MMRPSTTYHIMSPANNISFRHFFYWIGKRSSCARSLQHLELSGVVRYSSVFFLKELFYAKVKLVGKTELET